ncbi:MAG: 2-oxoglutarate dehydrogenase component, partial [Actinomycetia bacterium]|nr:2-oxoglutarate dehydrogenase component [Actinomycetes bacterium]
TQPRMYALIGQHRSVRKLYTEALVNRGDLTLEEAEAALDDFKHRLDVAFEETHQTEPPRPPQRLAADVTVDDVSTGVAREELDAVVTGLRARPEGFHTHPKLDRILNNQLQGFDDGTVDWSLAEQLAFGSLVLEGTPVRLAGQDSRRGTFSQRHAVLVDVETEQEYAPLAHLDGATAPFMIYDSVLSEFAALGFDYGYSVEAADTLVAWEAQFGDFINGAQTIIDEFVVAAEDKWGQRSALTMLLPHGFEGQGPDHSSARLERFLTLCADDNMRVVYPSTAAQYFHVLRRQVRTSKRRPLVCLTPKRYLRMPQTRSQVNELVTGSFQRVLDDRGPIDAAAVRRVVICTGKIGHELMDRRDRVGAPVAIVRLEQLYPVPTAELEAVLDRYPHANELWWCQEEPENMGAWGFVRSRLPIRDGAVLQVAAREASASPASGSQTVHEQEQEALLTQALGAP